MRSSGLACLLLTLGFTAAAQQRDPEWPCIQVLVPEIVAGVVWPQVIDETLAGTWEKDEALAAMAVKLSNLDEFTDTQRRLIADFAESVAADSRAKVLNQLADGIVTLSNQRRAQYISGIKRYTRQQISIASQIETRLNQLAELEGKPDAASAARKSEIEETLRWHQRVYDQREQAVRLLCERPVEQEEHLSAVMRELAQYLP
jgi:hypothetical protein